MSKETAFNNIGIDERLDWNRIRKLMIIGIFAACMVLAGDMLLGWGLHDHTKPGMEGFLSAYLTLPDSRIFWSAFLGLIGIPLEALCYFSVYRLVAPNSRYSAHLYRTGILGTLAFAGCGVHVPCLACVFFYNYMAAASPEPSAGSVPLPSSSSRTRLSQLHSPRMRITLVIWPEKVDRF